MSDLVEFLPIGVPIEFDPYRAFIEDVPDMVRRARDARKRSAYSYRDFLVGGAAFAWTIGTTETGVDVSGNTKSTKRKEKVCSEPKLLQKAKKAGYNALIGLVVVGTTDVNEIIKVNNFASPTLHPCTSCQGDLLNSPLVSESLIIVTAGSDSDIYQVHSLAELDNMYSSHSVETDQRMCQEGFGRAWTKRLPMYDALVLAEAAVPLEQQRSRAMLAKLAIAA